MELLLLFQILLVFKMYFTAAASKRGRAGFYPGCSLAWIQPLSLSISLFFSVSFPLWGASLWQGQGDVVLPPVSSQVSPSSLVWSHFCLKDKCTTCGPTWMSFASLCALCSHFLLIIQEFPSGWISCLLYDFSATFSHSFFSLSLFVLTYSTLLLSMHRKH